MNIPSMNKCEKEAKQWFPIVISVNELLCFIQRKLSFFVTSGSIQSDLLFIIESVE